MGIKFGKIGGLNLTKTKLLWLEKRIHTEQMRFKFSRD